MPTWDELIKGRTKMPSLRNSSHMIECMRIVTAKFPKATIAMGSKENTWKLVDGTTDLSNEHPSQYACWAEARKILESL